MAQNNSLDTIQKSIAQSVREIRKEHDLRQSDLAKLANVEQSLISRIEKNGCYSIDVLCKIMVAMNYDVEITFLPRTS